MLLQIALSQVDSQEGSGGSEVRRSTAKKNSCLTGILTLGGSSLCLIIDIMNSVWMAIHNRSSTDQLLLFVTLQYLVLYVEPAKLGCYPDIARFIRKNHSSPAEARKLKTHVFLLSNDVSL